MTAFPERYTLQISPSQTIVAIGDIHGDSDALRALLDLLKEHQLFDGTTLLDAQLIFTGDYIDRGFESKDVLTQLITLKENNPSCVHFLMGNHELIALSELDRVKQIIDEGKTLHAYQGTHGLNGGRETIRSYGSSDEKALKNYYDAFTTGKEADFLRSLKPLLLIQHDSKNYLFVHAGIPEVYVKNNLLSDALDEFDARIAIAPSEFGGTEEKYTAFLADLFMWDRDMIHSGREYLEKLKKELAVDHIIVGHTPTQGEIKEKAGVIDIDTGMVYGGEKQLLLINEEGIYKVSGSGEECIVKHNT